MRAYAYPSGLIGFGDAVPRGARVIARGPEQDLRDFITGKARLAPRTRALLVPGMPEADNQLAADAALAAFAKWIAIGAPKGVRVLPL